MNCKDDFPILGQKVNEHPLVYLDNAATTQKPRPVIDALRTYYEQNNANPHRGVHTLAGRATAAYEEARDVVKNFIAAQNREEIIFTRGTTQGLNWLAYLLAEQVLEPGDEILISPAEHHANLIPWQQMAKKHRLKLRYLPFKENEAYKKADLSECLTERTKLLALHHVSNVLGIEQPIKDLAQVMHQNDGMIVVDGAQAVPHLPVDVQDLDIDFYCFSGHKMYGPTGIGVMYGKKQWLDRLQPIEWGGEMITKVSPYESQWAEPPFRFEGGTQNIAGAVGLAAAIRWLKSIGGMENLLKHEEHLTQMALQQMQDISDLQIYGPENFNGSYRYGVISFNLEGVHPHDLATGLDQCGVAIRAGHHCAQVLMQALDVPATARISFAAYNTEKDLEAFITAIREVKEFFTL